MYQLSQQMATPRAIDNGEQSRLESTQRLVNNLTPDEFQQRLFRFFLLCRAVQQQAVQERAVAEEHVARQAMLEKITQIYEAYMQAAPSSRMEIEANHAIALRQMREVIARAQANNFSPDLRNGYPPQR